MKETDLLVKYLKRHPEVTDIIFTGGDPMIMSVTILRKYIEALLNADLPNLQNIRIGSKALTFWPYKFTSDQDANELLDLFKKVNEQGLNLSFMAHFNHPAELRTAEVKSAIQRILDTGSQIRTQAPIMRNINDDANDWSTMWKEQVRLGCIPYYMFVARDTGAQGYFSVPLERSWKIFTRAYREVSGICKTVRGPSMSADAGKIQVLGIQEIQNEKVFVLRFLQARDPGWIGKPFFAQYDPEAIWIDELKPAQGDKQFFFEKSVLKDHIDLQLAYN